MARRQMLMACMYAHTEQYIPAYPEVYFSSGEGPSQRSDACVCVGVCVSSCVL